MWTQRFRTFQFENCIGEMFVENAVKRVLIVSIVARRICRLFDANRFHCKRPPEKTVTGTRSTYCLVPRTLFP